MEGVRRARAMCRGIGQSIDDLQLLDDRAGPTVVDDEGKSLGILRADVDEMNVQPIDLGDEVRKGIQPRFREAPVLQTNARESCSKQRNLAGANGLLAWP